MILFRDVIYDGELFSDAFRLKITDDGSDCFTWPAKLVTQKAGGGIDASLIGGNASAEEAPEEAEETTTKTGFEFAFNHELEEYDWDKKMFQQWFKPYVKKVIKKLTADKPDKVDETKVSAQKFLEKVVEWFKEKKSISIYGHDHEEDDVMVQGNVVVLVWDDSGESGVAYCWRGAIREEKF